METDRSRVLQQASDLFKKEDLEAAKKVCRHWLVKYPDDDEILYILASVYMKSDLFKTAAKYLERCLEIEERYSYLNNLGIIYQKLEQPKKAEEFFTRAIALDPDDIEAPINFAVLLYNSERHEEAASYFKSVEGRSGLSCNYNYLYFSGQLKLKESNFLAARELFLKALRLRKDIPVILYVLAFTYYCEEKFHRAISIFERILENKNLGEAYTDRARDLLSSCYLSVGEFEKGWSLYCFKTRGKETKEWVARRSDMPYWSGENDPNCTLLVVAEEGIGDELLYTTFLQLLKDKVKNIYLECDARLRSLFERVFSGITFFDRDNSHLPKEIAEKCDRYVLLSDLPRYLNPKMDTRGAAIPLIPDHDRRRAIRESLTHKYPNKILVGVSYHTTAKNARDRMPPPEFWEDVFNKTPDNIVFINIQQNIQTKPEKRSFLYDHPKLHHIDEIDLYDDIEGLAALLDALDFIVSIGNYAAHLAGRLAKPTGVLLSRLCNCNYRWLLAADDGTSLWYPAIKLVKDKNWSQVKEQLMPMLCDLKGAF